MERSEIDMIRSLRLADNKTEGLLTTAKYRSTGLSPSDRWISEQLGWSEGKRLAGLKAYDHGKNPCKGKPVNVDFFKDIDTPEKAYWLGFIEGDGHISEKAVQIIQKEKRVIEEFKQAIESEHKPYYTGKTWKLSIARPEFVENTIQWIKPDKTHNGRLPDIDHINHFVRGLSDADGHFNPKQGTWRVVSASEDKLRDIQEIAPFKCKVYDNNTVKELYVEKGQPYEKWLYPQGRDTKPCLERKKIVALS